MEGGYRRLIASSFLDNNKNITTMVSILDGKKFWTSPLLVSTAKDIINRSNDGIREF